MLLSILCSISVNKILHRRVMEIWNAMVGNVSMLWWRFCFSLFFFCSVCSAVVFNSPTLPITSPPPPQCHHGVFIGMFFLVSSFSKLCLYKSKIEYLQHLYRALKSRALSVSLAHLDVISRSHAHTSISHPLALFWKVTLLFWPSEVLGIAKFFPSLPLNCLVLIN